MAQSLPTSSNQVNFNIILNRVPHGVCMYNKQGKVIYANRFLQKISGVNSLSRFKKIYPTNAALATQLDFRNTSNQPIKIRQLPESVALIKGKKQELIVRFTLSNRSKERWFLIESYPIQDKQGETSLILNTYLDITKLKDSEEYLKVINEVSRSLSSSLKYKERLIKFAHTVVGHVADWCAVDVMNSNGLEKIAIAHKDPQKIKLIQKLLKNQTKAQADFISRMVKTVIETGKPIYLPKISDKVITQAIRNQNMLSVIRQLNLKSLTILPLQARDKCFGAITFVLSESNKRYTKKDIQYLRILTERASFLIDNARLFEETQRQLKQEKEIRRELKRKEETLQLALSAGEMGFWDWDIQEGKLIWSNFLESLHGLRKGEFKDDYDQFMKLVHPEDRKELVEEIQQSIKNRSQYEKEFRIIWPDGSIHWMLGKGDVYFDSDNNATRMIGVGMDITDRKLNENALIESERKFKSIFDNSLEAIVIVNKNNQIIDFNKSAEQLFQRSGKSFHRKYLSKFLNPIPNDNRGEVDLIYPENLDLTLEYTRTNDFLPGRDLLFFRDITDRKIEEKRRDHFMGIASHELKNPLASIKAFVQILNRMQTDPQLKGYLSKIDDKTNMITRLINDLLDVTRIRQGKLEFIYESFKFDRLVKEVCQEIQLNIPTHQIKITGKTGKTVIVDKNRVSQAITNLVKNAIKYSPNANKVVVHLKSNKKKVYVSIKDFGIGISKKNQERVFDLYFRSETNIGHIDGLGVGLFIASQIIRQHGGTIWLRSEEGKGSTFYFSLPVIPTKDNS